MARWFCCDVDDGKVLYEMKRGMEHSMRVDFGGAFSGAMHMGRLGLSITAEASEEYISRKLHCA
jgi:hypothetical protein